MILKLIYWKVNLINVFFFFLILFLASDPSWKNVRVMIVNENEKVDLSGIRYCSFLDTNIISSQYGIVSYDSSLQLPSSITLTVFRNCILFPHCYIYQNTLVENAIILENSIIMGCGRICCQGTFLWFYINVCRTCIIWK